MSVDHGLMAATRGLNGSRRPASLATTSGHVNAVRLWLWSIAACVLLMVLVGGATRLTESGLSITEWEPLFGAIPPLTAAAWDTKFAAYRQIPQFGLHADMTLAEFKAIFFWEWMHRLLGRVLGLVIAVPLAAFWIGGHLPRGLKPRLVGLLVLVGFQGAVGWWMVKSGLAGRTEVSQYRLATHLLLATFTLGYVIWLVQGLARIAPDVGGRTGARLRWSATVILGLVFAQIGFGALVAGLRAGLVYNTWPTMGGRLVPSASELLARHPLWTNVFENLATVQFQHRMTAYALLLCAVVHAIDAARSARNTATARRAAALATMVACQAVIGIAALLLMVPIGVALAHQVFAMAVFAMAVVHRRALSQAGLVPAAFRA